MKRNVSNASSWWMLGLSVVTLLCSYGLEYVFDLSPCPLCIMQRLCTIILAFNCLGYFIFAKQTKTYIFFAFQASIILLGILTAGRQMWLQSLTATDNSLCMPGFEELVHYFSWDTILKMMFWGSNDCATVSWKFIGLPMSYWSMGYFLMMLFFLIRQIVSKFKQ